MCSLDSDFDMLHSKQLAVNNKQKAQMANDKLVETDARIGRITIRFNLSLVKAPRQKAHVERLINWRADKTQDSCRYVRFANTTAAPIAAAAVFGVLVKQRKANARTTNKSVA